MDVFANSFIDALGGTSMVARRAKAPISTVHNWRKMGLSPSRLDHLRRIAQNEYPSVDVDAIAAEHGVELPPIGDIAEASSGNGDDVSQQVAA